MRGLESPQIHRQVTAELGAADATGKSTFDGSNVLVQTQIRRDGNSKNSHSISDVNHVVSQCHLVPIAHWQLVPQLSTSHGKGLPAKPVRYDT